MKKLLLTTIALTAIGVAVKAKHKKEIKTYKFFSSSQEKVFAHMIDFINENKLDYVNHSFVDDGIIFSYK